MKYYLNVGTNLGDKKKNLLQAVEGIENALAVTSVISDIVESDPWGYTSPNSFMNVGMIVESDIEPMAMLKILQRLETVIGSSSHRNSDGTYADRVVDIDIVAVEENVLKTPELTIPHPLMHLRPFVLLPMIELEPLWKHPILLKTCQELLTDLKK